MPVHLGHPGTGVAAATAAFGTATVAGQGCALVTRLVLPRGRYEEGVDAIAVPDGNFFDLTLLADVTNDMEIAQDEVFGPVLVAIAHDGDDDAVAIANGSPYGLSGAVFSGDEQRAIDVARRIRTGTMSINGGVWYGADVPFGGYKQSGIGREMGVAGFEEYLETKSFARPAPR